MIKNNYNKILKEAGLRVTPQRIAVMEATESISRHPSSEDIAGAVRKQHPHIATGTIYNILDNFVRKGIFHRVKTEKGSMLYDADIERHHHLYCADSDRIEDYHDPELDELLQEYFTRKQIKGFRIEDIRLQLSGKFVK